MNLLSYTVTNEYTGFRIEYNSGTCTVNHGIDRSDITMINVGEFRVTNETGCVLSITVNGLVYKELNDILESGKNILVASVNEGEITINSVIYLESDEACLECDETSPSGNNFTIENWQWITGIDLLNVENLESDEVILPSNNFIDEDISPSNNFIDEDISPSNNFMSENWKWMLGVTFLTVVGALLTGGIANLIGSSIMHMFTAMSLSTNVTTVLGSTIIGLFGTGAITLLHKTCGSFFKSCYGRNEDRLVIPNRDFNTTLNLLNTAFKHRKSSDFIRPASFAPTDIFYYKWILKNNNSNSGSSPPQTLKMKCEKVSKSRHTKRRPRKVKEEKEAQSKCNLANIVNDRLVTSPNV